MNKSTQTAVTGEGNAPRGNLERRLCHYGWTEVSPGLWLKLLFGNEAFTFREACSMEGLDFDKGEQCAICGKDSWTCEHFDPREEAERNQ